MAGHACAPYMRPHDRESHINTVPACGPSGCFVLLYRNPRRRPYGFLIDKIVGGTGLLVAYDLLVPAMMSTQSFDRIYGNIFGMRIH